MAEPTRIGIIGQGNVGTALEKGLTKAGHEVRTVGKEPEKVTKVGEWANVVILAVPYGERENAMDELGETVNGKTLIDVTNAVTDSYEFAHDATTSGGEELQDLVGDVHVVKAFNTVFAQNMATGQVEGETLTVFLAGNDDGAKQAVADLARDIGFDAVDAGPIKNARWLETLGFLNIQLGYGQDLGTSIGFRLAGAPKTREMETATAQGGGGR